mgnify:CR=1 FL=1
MAVNNAADLLKDYKAKRNFARTQEPSGAAPKGGKTGRGVFVVQKHDATRLHFDFRIELDGVLKSWAVTKGPSNNPADKRLAVMEAGAHAFRGDLYRFLERSNPACHVTFQGFCEGEGDPDIRPRPAKVYRAPKGRFGGGGILSLKGLHAFCGMGSGICHRLLPSHRHETVQPRALASPGLCGQFTL